MVDMTEVIPQTNKVSVEKRKDLPKVRRASHPVEVADREQVRSVIQRMSDEGLSLTKACQKQHLSKIAVQRRILNDPELKRDLAGHLILEAHNRADLASEKGNVAAVGILAKLSRDMAASLAPSDWGEKTQIEGRFLVIHSNLFSEDAGEAAIDGFAAPVPDIEGEARD